MSRLAAGCVVCNRSAARVTDSDSNTAQKAWRRLRFMPSLHIKITCYANISAFDSMLLADQARCTVIA